MQEAADIKHNTLWRTEWKTHIYIIITHHNIGTRDLYTGNFYASCKSQEWYLHCSSRKQSKPIDNIQYPWISIYRPILEKQYSNWLAPQQCHVLCLIQQHSSIQYKQKYVCTSLSVVQKTKKLDEMLIWNKEEKFSSKQEKI